MAGDESGASGAEQESSRDTRAWLTNLRDRFATALLLIAIVVAIAFGGGWWAFAGTTVFTVLGLLELRWMLAQRGWHPIIVLSGALSITFLLAAMLPRQRTAIMALGISAMMIGSFSWLMLARKATLEGSLTDWALTVVLPFYLGWPMAFFLLLRGPTPGFQAPGFWWTLTTLFSVWAFDSFAFFGGRLFGRHQLAPLISPKKTWEGAVSGLIFALIAVALFTLPLHIAWYHVIAIGVLVSVAATIGDLAESLLKRDVGVKDSGTLIRGHGGVLDRVDSELFAVIVVFFYAAFLGSIPVR
jgi:phosphatidate cytidylyltransferase